MSSPFKDGIDAGLSDLKNFNSDLANASLGTDPNDFTKVVSLVGRAPEFISRMRSAFERIGENVHDDAKSFAGTQRQRLLEDCRGLLTQVESLTTLADKALTAANQAKELRDGADGDEDKKSKRDDAEQRLREAADELRQQGVVVRGGLEEFFNTLRDVSTQFKNFIASTQSFVDANQSQVEQVLGDIRGIEDQLTGKDTETKSLFAQRESQTRAYLDLVAKLDDKLRAEKEADRALAEGAKKDSGRSDSDLQSLEQASLSAQKERERAEAEGLNYWDQTAAPTDAAYRTKVAEAITLRKQLSSLKQRRDALIDDLSKSRTALTELSKEYQEPSF